MWINNVTCEGTEASIYKCPNAGWDKVGAGCPVDKYAGVHCFSSGYEVGGVGHVQGIMCDVTWG